MAEKDKDLFLDMLENPNLTLEDLVSVGHSAESSRFLDKSMYENSQRVRNKFTDSEGNFKKDEFDKWYALAANAYQDITNKDVNLGLLNVTAFNESDITVSPEKRTLNTKPLVSFTPNPDRLSTSIYRIGKTSQRERSQSELAQAEKILLNPVEAANDPSKAKWGDSPNDAWWKNFFDTLVLALWDEDGEHIDPVTKQKVQHTKGELKLNDNGTYYYESLDGRDIYGRLVLNKMNTITTDGTFWNQYDFFDSDDIKEKSFVGSVAKNLALVGSMFIPYVGWGIAGASVATQLIGLTGTLGKMLTGSDSPTFSSMEGWAKSLNRQSAKTEYAQQHTLCWENFIDLIGDTTALLREQRAIFKFAPAAFGKGKYGIESKHFGMNSEALKAKEVEALLKAANPNLNMMKMARAVGAETSEEAKAALGKAITTKNSIISNIADKAVADYFKNYNELGEKIARAYMVGITVGDTYGEAKEAGASDFEATMLTLGYAAAENALLNSELGRWIFPELKAERATMSLVAKKVLEAPEKLSAEGVSSTLRSSGIKTARAELLGKRIAEMPENVRELSQNLGRATEGDKLAWMRKWFNAGKEVFDSLKSVMKGTLGAMISNSLAEGTEEVSEELLKDFSTSCFNLYKAAQGNKDVRMQGFLGTWDWNEALKRYGMSFFGGAVGGSINSAATDYSQFKNIANMTSEQAMQLLVWMERNNEMDKFWDTVSKETLGDKYHSTLVDENGQFKLGTKEDNLDVAAKKALRQQIDMIHNILSSSGAKVDDDGLIGQVMNALPAAKNRDILGDFRTNALATSVTAGRFLKEYNKLCAAIILESNKLKNLTSQTVDSKQPSDDLLNAIAESKASLKNLQDAKNSLLSGERSAEFYKDAMFETTYGVSESFLAPTEIQFAERLYKKPYALLTKEEKENSSKLYATWSTTERAEQIHMLADVFYDIAGKTSAALQQSSEMFLKMKEGLLQKVRTITDLSNTKLNLINDILATGGPDTLERVQEIISGISMNSEGNLADPMGLIIDAYENYATRAEALLSDVLNVLGNGNNAFGDKYRAIVEDSALDNEAKASKLVEAFADTIHKELVDTALEIIDSGYIHPEVKRDLLPTLQLTLNYCITTANEFESRAELLEEDLGNSQTADNAAAMQDKMNSLAESLQEQINQIEKLNYTPIADNLKNFAIGMNSDKTVLSLLEEVINKEKSYLESIGDILLSGTDAQLFDEAEKLLKLYRASIVAARHDNADVSHIFGYNKTLNELCKSTDGWVPLAEIDADTANLALEDINMALSRLDTIRGISALNQGNKLNTQNHTAANKSYILFNKTSQILTNLLNEDDNDARAVAAEWNTSGLLTKLKDVINGMSKHKELTGNTVAERELSLNPELKKIIEQEQHAMDDALYTFFQENMDKVKNPESLARLLKTMGLDFYHKNEDLLTQDSETIDDGAYLWWLASKAALKSSDFYKEYRKVITEDIAPIPTLELGVYAAIAAINDGAVFDAFGKAARQFIYEDWKGKTPSERSAIIKNNKLQIKRNGHTFDLIPSEDASIEDVWQSELVPNFTNILFIEGIPGSGKSTGVFKTIAKILNNLKNKENSNWLKGQVVVAHSNQKNAEALAGSLNFEGTDVKAYGKDELLHWMAPSYKNTEDPESGQYHYYDGEDAFLGKDGIIHSNWEVRKIPEAEVPSVIFIDEWSRYTQPEVDLINRFASEYGVQVIAGGDMDLLSPVAYLLKNKDGKISDKETVEMSNSRNIVARIPKLGISMRTGNGQKTRNLHTVLSRMRNLDNTDSIELLYVETDLDLFGDKVYSIKEQSDKKNEITDSLLQEMKADIDKMIKNLDKNKKEKIGYIYSNTDSKLYQLLSSAPYKDKIDFKNEAAAQGLEARYYIVENNRSSVQEADAYLKSLYTGISRAELASIVLTPSVPILGIQVIRPSRQENKLIPDNFTADGIARFSVQRKDLLDKLYEDKEDSKLSLKNQRERVHIDLNPVDDADKTKNDKKKKQDNQKNLEEKQGEKNAENAANGGNPVSRFNKDHIITDGTNYGIITLVEEPQPGQFSYKVAFGSEVKTMTEEELNAYEVTDKLPEPKPEEGKDEGNGGESKSTVLEPTTENFQKVITAFEKIAVPFDNSYYINKVPLAHVLGVQTSDLDKIITGLENLGVLRINSSNNYKYFPEKAAELGLIPEITTTPEEKRPSPKYKLGDAFEIFQGFPNLEVIKIEWDDNFLQYKYSLSDKEEHNKTYQFGSQLDALGEDKFIPKSETTDGRQLAPLTAEGSLDLAALQDAIELMEDEGTKDDPEIEETENGDIDLHLYGYTQTTNYVGVKFDEESGKPIMPLLGEPGAERIDAANGLIKLDPIKFRNIEACRTALGIIRQAMMYESNSEIERVLRNLIPSLKNKEITIEWAFISKATNRNLAKGGGGKFYYDPDTKLDYMEEGESHDEVPRKTLSMVVKDKSGNYFLEMPILQLSSPFTALYLLGQLNPENKIFLVYDKARTTSASHPDVLQKVIEAIDSLKETKDSKGKLMPGYKKLKDLCTLWKFSSDGIQFLPKVGNVPFNLAQHADNLGSKYIKDRITEFTICNNKPKYEYASTWHDLTEESKRADVYYSDVMIATSEYNANGNKVVAPGNPFVLRSNSYKFKTNLAMMDQYFKQLKDPKEPKYVTLEILAPPQCSISEYLIERSKLEDCHYGREFTSYRILSIIRKLDPKGLWLELEPGLRLKTKKILDTLDKIQEEYEKNPEDNKRLHLSKIYKALKEAVMLDDSFHILDLMLFLLTWDTEDGKKVPKMDVIEKILQLCNISNPDTGKPYLEGVLYRPVCKPRSEIEPVSDYGLVIETGDTRFSSPNSDAIRGGSFRIYSRYDNPKFEVPRLFGEIAKWVNQIDWGGTTNSGTYGNLLRFTHSWAYGKYNSTKQGKPVNEKSPNAKLKEKHSALLEKLGLKDYNKLDSITNETDFLEAIKDKYIETPGNIAIVVGGNDIIYTNLSNSGVQGEFKIPEEFASATLEKFVSNNAGDNSYTLTLKLGNGEIKECNIVIKSSESEIEIDWGELILVVPEVSLPAEVFDFVPILNTVEEKINKLPSGGVLTLCRDTRDIIMEGIQKGLSRQEVVLKIKNRAGKQLAMLKPVLKDFLNVDIEEDLNTEENQPKVCSVVVHKKFK